MLYPFYQAASAPWPLSPRTDQELAGTLMWMGGMVGYLIAGTIVFFRWATREGAEDAAPVTPLPAPDSDSFSGAAGAGARGLGETGHGAGLARRA